MIFVHWLASNLKNKIKVSPLRSTGCGGRAHRAGVWGRSRALLGLGDSLEVAIALEVADAAAW